MNSEKFPIPDIHDREVHGFICNIGRHVYTLVAFKSPLGGWRCRIDCHRLHSSGLSLCSAYTYIVSVSEYDGIESKFKESIIEIEKEREEPV